MHFKTKWEGLSLFSCNYPDPSKCFSPVLKTYMCVLHSRSLFGDGFVPSLHCPAEQVCTEKTLPQRNEEMFREHLEVVRVLVVKQEWTRKALWQPGSHTEKCSSVTQCGLPNPYPRLEKVPQDGVLGCLAGCRVCVQHMLVFLLDPRQCQEWRTGRCRDHQDIDTHGNEVGS